MYISAWVLNLAAFDNVNNRELYEHGKRDHEHLDVDRKDETLSLMALRIAIRIGVSRTLDRHACRRRSGCNLTTTHRRQPSLGEVWNTEESNACVAQMPQTEK